MDARAVHDRQAPAWASVLALLLILGVSTIWVDLGWFWSGYVLDLTGPAWTYILVRGRFTAWADNGWTRFFTPIRTVLILGLACLAMEGAQLLELYDSTFDPWDLLAYATGLGVVFFIDVGSGAGRRP